MPESKFKDLVSDIVQSYKTYPNIVNMDGRTSISKTSVIDILEKLQTLIFGGYFGSKHLKREIMDYYAADLLEDISHNLEKQIGRALYEIEEDETPPDATPKEIAWAFLKRLPEIRKVLSTDVDAAFDGDPAAVSTGEICLSYPGLYAVMVNRLAHELYVLGVPLIPRMMTEHAHSLTGIDIHPGASIGHHFFIDHGTGVVVGETTVIGNHVKIYQGVTLGALSTHGGQMLRGIRRHPTIEDHVTIYAGASILGGSTVIGEGVVIGSNAFIIKSVPEMTKVSIKSPELSYVKNNSQRTVDLEQNDNWYYMI
ncbi:MAG: serine acetyltransferase [Clostridiales bacterium]|jgi:serine O-acetyltransferase|nr:serine acetyltransferase [Clostridiales bacterium]